MVFTCVWLKVGLTGNMQISTRHGYRVSYRWHSRRHSLPVRRHIDSTSMGGLGDHYIHYGLERSNSTFSSRHLCGKQGNLCLIYFRYLLVVLCSCFSVLFAANCSVTNIGNILYRYLCGYGRTITGSYRYSGLDMG